MGKLDKMDKLFEKYKLPNLIKDKIDDLNCPMLKVLNCSQKLSHLPRKLYAKKDYLVESIKHLREKPPILCKYSRKIEEK